MNDDKPEKMPPVPPFVRFVASAVPMVFDDSLSYYEALCALWKYVQDMTDVINNNATLEEEYIEKFNELKSYVENYFDNLDVQEEINNKLDAMVEDGTLQDLINNYLQPNVTWTFDTVADMKASTNLVSGGYAQTLGYHSLNDGGAALYYIDTTGTADEASIIAIGDTLKAHLCEKGEINPIQFGAYGDGTHDDADALNACFLYGFINHFPVHLLSKTYGVASTLVIYGGQDDTHGGSQIYGDSRGLPKFKVLDTLTDVIQLDTYDNAQKAHEIFLSDFSIAGQNLATNGINFVGSSVDSSILKNIYIRDMLGDGIKQTSSDVYLNTFDKIRCDNCVNGMNLIDGNNTSNNIVNCYMVNCQNGYKIKGVYSNLNNCCADGITSIVFYFYYFTGNVLNPGAESPAATKVFEFNHANVNIEGAFTFGNFTSDTASHLYVVSSSIVNVSNSKILVYTDGTISSAHTAPGKLYACSSSSRLSLNNVEYSPYLLDNNYQEGDSVVSINDTKGNVSILNTKILSYIGKNTVNDNGLLNPSCSASTLKTNAIFLGMGDSVRYTAGGTDMRWFKHNMKGDILLSQNAEKIGGIGWIQTDGTLTSSNTWENGSYLKIPVIHSGATADRPTTSLVVGQMFYDTTLNKPIWYKGSSTWVDSTGTTV